MNYGEIVEGLLFLSGDDGMSCDEIKKIIDVDNVDDIMSSLIQKYSTNSGLEIVKFGSKYKMVTKSKYADYFKKMADNYIEGPVSQAGLEILAIIAYNEPITRIQIDEIRGVNSSYALRKLLVRGLVTECGKSDVAGHPNLYKTTDRFLDYFGLKSKKDLIPVNTEFEIIEDVDLFDTKYKENNNEEEI